MEDKIKDLIEEMQQKIESCERRIEMYGKNHTSSIRLHAAKKSISKYKNRLKNIYEATESEASKCGVCGAETYQHDSKLLCSNCWNDCE